MKRINSYKAVASFVRAFFEAYARGIIDATVGGDDFKKKNDPKEIKQLMLDHYGEVNQYSSMLCSLHLFVSTIRQQRKLTNV